MQTERIPLIEEVKGYWNANPCNSLRSRNTPGEMEYFLEIRNNKRFVEPHTARFAEFPHWSRRNVLEIGCGLGVDTISFAHWKANVTAVDVSRKSLELARQHARLLGLENRIHFVEADVEEFNDPGTAGGWDLIYSFGVLHHTPNPLRALESLRYLASPHTELRIMLYHRHSWKMLWTKQTEAVGGCPVAYTFTREEARILVESAGWTITDMEVAHIFPYKIPEYQHGRYVKTALFRHMPDVLFRWMERHWGWHLLIRATPTPPSPSLSRGEK